MTGINLGELKVDFAARNARLVSAVRKSSHASALEDEIEITPEMIDAGLSELCEAKSPLADDVSCVTAIYRAMFLASPAMKKDRPLFNQGGLT